MHFLVVIVYFMWQATLWSFFILSLYVSLYICTGFTTCICPAFYAVILLINIIYYITFPGPGWQREKGEGVRSNPSNPRFDRTPCRLGYGPGLSLSLTLPLSVSHSLVCSALTSMLQRITDLCEWEQHKFTAYCIIFTVHCITVLMLQKVMQESADLSHAEDFNGMPVSVSEWQRGRSARNDYFVVAQTESQTWIAGDKFDGHEILACRQAITDWSGVEEHLAAGRCRRHKLKAQFIVLTRLQWLQHQVAAAAGQCDLRLLTTSSLKAHRTRTAENTQTQLSHDCNDDSQRSEVAPEDAG